MRYEIGEAVVASIKEKAGGHEDARSTAHRAVGQIVKQSWDCSQIEKEEEVGGQWMHEVAPKEASTCRSKGPKVSGLKEHMTSFIACNSLR